MLSLLIFTSVQKSIDYFVAKKIENAEFCYPDAEWSEVSDYAKNFISQLIVRNPRVRREGWKRRERGSERERKRERGGRERESYAKERNEGSSLHMTE